MTQASRWRWFRMDTAPRALPWRAWYLVRLHRPPTRATDSWGLVAFDIIVPSRREQVTTPKQVPTDVSPSSAQRRREVASRDNPKARMPRHIDLICGELDPLEMKCFRPSSKKASVDKGSGVRNLE